MNKNVKMGVYTKGEEQVAFNFYTSLTASKKLTFVNSVVNTIIDDNYNSIIKDVVFDYIMIQVFTDIDTAPLEDIDKIEEFLADTNVISIIKENVESGLIDELNKAVDMNIEYRTGIHKNPIGEVFANLLNTLENKIDNINIDTDSMMKMAEVFNGISGELTVDKVLEAYSKSDTFKKNRENMTTNNITNKEQGE
jgi:hypothetical protein